MLASLSILGTWVLMEMSHFPLAGVIVLLTDARMSAFLFGTFAYVLVS